MDHSYTFEVGRKRSESQRRRQKWPWDYSDYSLHLQSPIDITFSKVRKVKFDPLNIYIPKDIGEIRIKNSGQGVTVSVVHSDDTLTISGSFLEDYYLFDNMHYHWGALDYIGSEHFIDGEAYSAEAHLEMYKKCYGSIDNALDHKDGVIVLGFFFQVGSLNPRLENFLKYLQGVRKEGSALFSTESDLLLWFLPDLMLRNDTYYYTFPGSLTTPPYSESVTYIILPTPLCICPTQLNKFRGLTDKEGDHVISNRRELQPLMYRPMLLSDGISWNCQKEVKIRPRRLRQM